jgi:hypothetical protein
MRDLFTEESSETDDLSYKHAIAHLCLLVTRHLFKGAQCVQVAVQQFMDMRRANLTVLIKEVMPFCSNDEVDAIVTHDDGVHVHKLILAVKNVCLALGLMSYIIIICCILHSMFCKFYIRYLRLPIYLSICLPTYLPISHALHTTRHINTNTYNTHTHVYIYAGIVSGTCVAGSLGSGGRAADAAARPPLLRAPGHGSAPPAGRAGGGPPGCSAGGSHEAPQVLMDGVSVMDGVIE